MLVEFQLRDSTSPDRMLRVLQVRISSPIVSSARFGLLHDYLIGDGK